MPAPKAIFGRVTLHSPPSGSGFVAIPFIIDGGGFPIVPDSYGDVQIPYAVTIVAVRMFADQAGDLVADILASDYAGFPPSASITASAPPTLSSADHSEDTTLTGWTTALDAGTILRFVVDSAATITRVTIELIVAQ